MLTRSAAVKRDRTRLLRSMKVRRREAPVQGLRGSLRHAKRPGGFVMLSAVILHSLQWGLREEGVGGFIPSVKSIETLFAPVSKQPLISFSHSFTKSSTNVSLGYPSTVPLSGYSKYSILGAMTACFMPWPIAYGYDFLKFSYAYVLYFSGPLVSRGNCR